MNRNNSANASAWMHGGTERCRIALLLVVKDPDFCKLLLQICDDNQYRMDLVHLCAQAIQIYNENKYSYDAILMGVDVLRNEGFALVQHIRACEKEIGERIPIIAVGPQHECLARPEAHEAVDAHVADVNSASVSSALLSFVQ